MDADDSVDWPFVAVAVRREAFLHSRSLSGKAIARWTGITRPALASSLTFTGLAPRHVAVVLADPSDILANGACHRVSSALDCHENASSAFAVHALADAELRRKQGWVPFGLSATLEARDLPHARRDDLHLHVHFRDVVLSAPNGHSCCAAHVRKTSGDANGSASDRISYPVAKGAIV